MDQPRHTDKGMCEHATPLVASDPPYNDSTPRSRSVQTPGSEFHPRDKSDKIIFGFLEPFWCNKKVNPET